MWDARVVVRLRGGGLAVCRLDEFYSFVEVFVFRQYDLAAEVPWESVRAIVDVGANVGAATLWFARQSPRATIIAVEPASEVVSRLRWNLRANHLEDRVSVVEAALTNRTGEVYLEVPRRSVFSRVSSDRGVHGEAVRSLTLQHVMKRFQLREIDVLKLDCEGSEFEILLSSDSATLRRVRFIVGEYHSASRIEVDALMGHLAEAQFDCSTAGDGPIGLFHAVRQ
jgi:FkbM family methyltransferase